MDATFNQMIDRGSINNNPPIITPSDHEDELNPFGPGVKWKSDNPNAYRVLELPKQEQMEFAKMNFLLGMVQKLFGVMDYAVSDTGGLASNRTASGIATVVGEGNIKFDDMIRALQDTNEDLYEFIVNLNADNLDDDFIYQLTEQQDNPFKSINKSYWAGNYDFESVGNSVNINRELEQNKASAVYKTVVESFGKNPAVSELTVLDASKNYFTAMDVRNVRLKDEQTMQAEKQQAQEMQAQMAQAQMQLEMAKVQPKQTAAPAQPAQRPPTESINYKDLPPSGRVQMAAAAGIHLSLEEAMNQVAMEHAQKMPAPKAPAQVPAHA